MTEDIVKSIKAALYDRTTSPLFGALAVSWSLWNYKIFVVLFSGMTAPEKLAYIQNSLYGDSWDRALFWVIGPIVTALVFLFLYPYPAKWVFRFWRRRQKELRDIRQEIEDATPLTIEESRRIRRQIIDIQAEHDREIARRSEELERTKQALTDREASIEELQKELLGARSVSTAHSSQPLSDEELASVLRSSPYRLFHNPERGRKSSKTMMFGPSGRILEGSNENEHTWRIVNGKLELLQADGKVHSRFQFHPTSKVFTHTNDQDTLSKRGQFLIPEPDASASKSELS